MSAPVSPAAKVTIDIWSDVMCPWCVIGYQQLQTALVELDGEIEAELRWLPFELNPDMPPEGEDQAAHIGRKYGRTPDQVGENRAQLIAVGQRAGYSFAYAGAADPPPRPMMWNTFAAHKLLKWVLVEHGAAVQVRLKLALFDAHFQQRLNVSDPAVLLDAAAALGLDRGAAQAALADEALGVIVRREQEMAFDRNITGVPAMLVNGKYLIPGAQEPAVYANALRRVAVKDSVAQQD